MTVTPQRVEAAPTPQRGVGEVRTLVRRGRIGEALATLLDVPPPEAGDDPTERALVLAIEVECRMALGEMSAAIDAAGQLEPLARTRGVTAAIALYSRADLAAALGEPELAVERFLASGRADDSGFVPWRSGAALAMLRLGRRPEAHQLALDHLARLSSGAEFDVATALRTLATTDPDGRGLLLLRAAQAQLADSDAERLRAQIATDLAGRLLLAGGGGHDEAVALLRSAEAYAAREDLWPLQSRVRRLLDRLGETPRRMEAEALAVLTAGERRVTLLALEGYTNRAIAEHLGVSVKAVEGHLSKVYRKLNVVSRAGLSTSLRVTA